MLLLEGSIETPSYCVMFLEDNAELLKNTYKNVRLYPELLGCGDGNNRSDEDKMLRRKFRPCVSFNTVPSYLGDNNGDDGLDFPGVQIPAEYTMEEYYDDESGYMSNNAEYFLRNNYVTNNKRRGGSPPPRNLGVKGAALSSMFRIAENGKIVRVDYPTTPTITSDAIVINRAQPGWSSAWLARKKSIQERVENKQRHFRYPDVMFPQQPAARARIISSDGYTPISKDEKRKERVLREKVGFPNSPRTILCHISGRRHTWVALDWAVRELAQNSDHIVVVANIPRFANANASRGRNNHRLGAPIGNHRSRSVEPTSPDSVQKPEQFVEWTSGYSAQMVSNKLEDILTYIAVIVPKEIKIKVTVEIVIGKTKKAIINAMDVYTPDFCTSTTLKWQRNDSLVLWKAKNLTDILCTKYPIPVFVLPVKRMYEFEANLQKDFAPEGKPPGSSELSSQSPNSQPPQDDQTRESPTICLDGSNVDPESDFSDSGSNGVSINTSSKNDLIEAARKHREEISNGIKEVDVKGSGSPMDRKVEKLDIIFNASLELAMQVQDMTPEERESGFTHLRRVITGDNEVKKPATRSMVDFDDVPKKPSKSNVSGGKPRASRIKFAPNVNANDGNRALGNSKIKVTSAESSPPPIQRHISSQDRISPRSSHDEPLRKTKSSQPSVRKVRSTSNISRVRSNDSMASSGSSSSSKKMGGFLSLFKRSGSRSRSTSRRNSDVSDTDEISVNDGDAGKKRRSRLFGFS